MPAIAFLCLFLPLNAFAKLQSTQPIVIPMELDDRLVIRGYEGKLEILPTQSQELRVEAMRGASLGAFNQWNFHVSKKKNLVELIVKGPAEKEDWNKVRAGQRPSFSFKVFVPARPIEISWYKGTVTLKNIKSSVTLQLTDGRVSAENCLGTIAAQLINGSIDIKNHNGNIKLQTYKGAAKINGTKGVLTLDNHSSRYQITGHQGSAEIKNFNGPLLIQSMEGGLTLFNKTGTITVKDHSGSVRGDTGKGNLNVKALQIQDFVMKSDSGAVILRLPKSSGALVSIRSEKGQLQAYKYDKSLRKIRKGLWTELKGQLKGGEQGNIKIVSKYGNIVLK